MGNTGSSVNHGGRRRHSSHDHHHQQQQAHQVNPSPQVPAPIPQQPQPAQPPGIPDNRYVFAAEIPYPSQFLNPNAPPPPYYQYAGYYPPPPPPLPAPYDHHHRNGGGGGPHHPANWGGGAGGGGRYPYAPPPQPAPYMEHQKAVTIRNDVNLKKETLRVEPDESNPGRFLVAFSFDATVAGSITIHFFAKEGLDCSLSATKDNSVEPITVSFNEGLGQKFRQPSGTGIDFSMFEEVELMKEGEMEVYPLAVKAEASPSDDQNPVGENHNMSSLNSQITQAVFEKKEKGDYRVRVVKQILWVNGTRYELQEIYGIGNSVDSDFDGNDPGKECVICLSEPRDTTVLPCRHMKYDAAGTVRQNYASILLMLLRLWQAYDHPVLVKGYRSDTVGKDSLDTAKQLPKNMLFNLLHQLEGSLAICRVCNNR